MEKLGSGSSSGDLFRLCQKIKLFERLIDIRLHRSRWLPVLEPNASNHVENASHLRHITFIGCHLGIATIQSPPVLPRKLSRHLYSTKTYVLKRTPVIFACIFNEFFGEWVYQGCAREHPLALPKLALCLYSMVIYSCASCWGIWFCFARVYYLLHLIIHYF